MPPRTTGGYPPLYVLSTLLFLVALGGIAILIGTDVLHGLRVSILHQRLDALPLITIGLSYITLNLASNQDLSSRLKGVFLGVAFLCWGGEQLLPPSRLVTLLDEGAVTLFVVDLSAIIWSRIREAGSARPETRPETQPVNGQ